MDTSNPQLQITRRHLPHWTIHDAVYFVTFRTKSTVLSEKEQVAVLKHIKEGQDKYYSLLAAVVMPDHVHILLRQKSNYDLSRIMKGIKGVSANKINRMRKTKGSIWLNESFDRIIRNQKEFDEKFNYMLNNPVKKELTLDPWTYQGWYFNREIFE
ncbi:MAG: transposase [Ignavibacteriae bacterium]|nr:transposase [Ignavibacteriota bacterium]